MNSAATTNIQPRPRPTRKRHHIGRQHRGQQDAADHGGTGETEGAADLDDLAVDREDRAHHAEIDRKEHADRDQRDLRGLENAEPENEQRHPGDRGNRAQRLHGGIEQPPRQSPIAGDRAEQRAGDHAEAEAEHDAGHGRLDVQPELAGARQFGDGGEHLARRRHQPSVGPAAPDDELPGQRESDRQQQPERRPRQARPARRCARGASVAGTAWPACGRPALLCSRGSSTVMAIARRFSWRNCKVCACRPGQASVLRARAGTHNHRIKCRRLGRAAACSNNNVLWLWVPLASHCALGRDDSCVVAAAARSSQFVGSGT